MAPEEISTEVLLVHDAVLIIARALTKVKVVSRELQCEEYDSWVYGSTMMNFMKTVRTS